MAFSIWGWQCRHTAGLGLPDKVYCIPVMRLPLQVEVRGLTCVPSSFSHGRVYGLNGGYFFHSGGSIRKAIIKDAINRGKGSRLSCSGLVWRQAASVGQGRPGEKARHQRSKENHLTRFLLKAYGVANLEDSGVLALVKIIKQMNCEQRNLIRIIRIVTKP